MISELYQIIGSTVAIVTFIIVMNRYLREKPNLKYAVKSCNHSIEKHKQGHPLYIDLQFLLDNSGERGTSITNISLVKVNSKIVNVKGCGTSFYSEIEWKKSSIIIINSRTSLMVSSKFSVISSNTDDEIDLEFKLSHTTGELKINTKSKRFGKVTNYTG